MKLWYNKSEKGDCDKRFIPPNWQLMK